MASSVFAMFALLLLAASAAASSPSARCAKTSINIRSGASTTFSIVDRAQKGDAFVTHGTATKHGGLEWYQVSSCGSQEVIGWMAMHPQWQEECSCPVAPAETVARNAVARATGRWPLHYDKPTRCSRGPQRGTRALATVLRRHFPAVYSTGIFNCRSVRGGSSLSEHGEGRAVDFMVPTDKRHQNLADFLVTHARDLGIQSVIYNRRVWGYGRWRWRRYSGSNAHVDHVHTGMHWDGARGLTEADIEGLFSGRRPTAAPGGGGAGTAGESCTDGRRNGACQSVSSCRGTTTAGLCPGPSSVRCCFGAATQAPVTAAPVTAAPVTRAPGATPCSDRSGRSGSCLDVSTCDGVSSSGLCPGPRNIRCCFPVAEMERPTPPPQVAPPQRPSGPSCRDRSTGQSGMCLDVGDCNGQRKRGLCPGPSSVQCCFGDSASNGGASASALSGSPPCSDRNGDTGSCMNFRQCSLSGNTPKRGLCPGPAVVQCCFQGRAAIARSTEEDGGGGEDDLPADECVRVSHAVNIHASPSVSSPTLLVAFADEEWTERDRQGAWVHVTNARGSGFGFHSFFESCDAEIVGRSLSGVPGMRIGDAPRTLDDWAIGLVTGLAVAFVACALLVAYYVNRRKNAEPGDHWKSMEEPLMNGGTASPAPQRTSKRASVRTSPRLSAKGGSALVQPSPGLARRKGDGLV